MTHKMGSGNESTWGVLSKMLVSVPDQKPTPVRIAFSIVRVILEAIYAPDEDKTSKMYDALFISSHLIPV